MCRFTEAICIEGGAPLRIRYHNRRCSDTRRKFFPGCGEIDLEGELRDRGVLTAAASQRGKQKCRIEYGEDICDISITPYTPRRIGSLRLVYDDTMDYSFKYADRGGLERAEQHRDGADAVIIVRNNRLTDTTFSNIALYDGGKWVVPDTYLLPGTMRSYLLDTGQVRTAVVRPEDLRGYEKISLINAMLDLGESAVPVSAVFT